MKPTLADLIARFGKAAKAKLSNPSVTGEPEDQLRAPFEKLVSDMAALCGFGPGAVVTVGETSIAALRTRPDYAVTVNDALVGFVELNLFSSVGRWQPGANVDLARV